MAKTCNRCGRQIVAVWRTAKGNFYHPHCFTCAICDLAIESEHRLDNCNLKEIYCKRCYEDYFIPIGEDNDDSQKKTITAPSTMIPSGFMMEGDSVRSLLMQQMPPLFNSECSVNTSRSDARKEIQPQIPPSMKHHEAKDVGDNLLLKTDETHDNEQRMIENMEISTVLESTKPPAFMNRCAAEFIKPHKVNWRPDCLTDVELTRSNTSHSMNPHPLSLSKSKIPKRKETAVSKKYSSQSECSGSEMDNNNNPVLDKKLSGNKFLPKHSQSLIRPQSFSIPQQIKTKMNDYINSKGRKFANISKIPMSTPSVTPMQNQHPQQQEKSKKTTPVRAIHVPIPASDAKKMSNSNRLKSGISSKTLNSSESCMMSKAQSAINASAKAATGRTKSSAPCSTTKVKAENKLSNFKMPSFIVPCRFKPIHVTNPDLCQESFKAYSYPEQGFRRKLSHYILPHEIMHGTVKHRSNDSGCGTDSENNEEPTISVSSYFGNVTLPRPIPKGSGHDGNANRRKIKKPSEASSTALDTGRNLDCPICMDKLVNLHPSEGNESDGSKCQENVVTCCGHIFHKECIHRWLSTNGNDRCPTCSKLCLKESMIPVYIEANIADSLSIKNADNDELKALLNTLRIDYKQLREKYQELADEHRDCATRFAITDSLRSAYEMESRTRGQLQWENKLLHQKLQELRASAAIEQGDICNYKDSCHGQTKSSRKC